MPHYITNDTASPMYVGGRLIPPFDGRHFEDWELPSEYREPAAPVESAAPTAAELVRELLEGTVKAITEQLPGLGEEQLDLIQDIEAAEQNRKTLLEAVRAEQVRRADEKLRADQEQQRQAAIDAARDELLKARVAQTNLPPGAPEADKVAAQARVDEAQAKVDALTDAEHEE